MNERMIELYKEACEFAYKVCKDEGREGGTGDHIWNTLSTGRFAELIVRECMQLCKKQSLHYAETENQGSSTSAAEVCRIIIKQHFGVTE